MTVDRILQLRDSDLSAQDIAECLRCSVTTVQRRLHAAGLALSPRAAARLGARVRDPGKTSLLGALILEHARRLDLSQSDLARRLGLHSSTINGWVKGTARPSWTAVVALAEALEVEASQIADQVLLEVEQEVLE